MLQTEPERYRRFYLRIVAIVASVSMPLSVFVSIYAEEISALILGDQWRGAATFIRIFGIGAMLQSVYSTIGFVLVSRGRSGQLLALAVIQATVKASLMTLGLRWGAVGVAIGDISTPLIMFAPYLYVSFKDSPVTIDAFQRSLMRPFIASVVTALILVFFRATVELPSVISLFAAMLVTATVFPALWLMLPGGRLELRELRSSLRVALDRAN
jgi:PST family polysaccharide transporter